MTICVQWNPIYYSLIGYFSITLDEYNSALQGKLFLLRVDRMLGRALLSRGANRRSQLFLSVEMAKNTISTREASYTVNRSCFLGTVDWCRLMAMWDLSNL